MNAASTSASLFKVLEETEGNEFDRDGSSRLFFSLKPGVVSLVEDFSCFSFSTKL